MEPARTAPRVSVLIRAYRRPALLANAIESVLAQTYADFEVVVSDDSGELGPICERFRDPRVRHSANPAPLGPAANLRRAAELARGELLAILNDDDQWLPRFLETAVRRFDLDPGLGVVFTDYWSDVGGRRVRNRFPYAAGRNDSFLRQLLEHSIPVSGNLMRREVWEDGERRLPLRTGMVGDDTTWLRAAGSGWGFHYVPEPLAVMRVHRGQLSWSERELPGGTSRRLELSGSRIRRASGSAAHGSPRITSRAPASTSGARGRVPPWPTCAPRAARRRPRRGFAQRSPWVASGRRSCAGARLIRGCWRPCSSCGLGCGRGYCPHSPR